MTVTKKEADRLGELSQEISNMAAALTLVTASIDGPVTDALFGIASHARRIAESVESFAEMIHPQ